jgi:(R,R)-butanediol dehydrogenase / meso-butanediol dehydrogenase / diacetyl reductase
MRAARYHAARDIRIDDIAQPEITNPDDVLVEVSFCGICGTDLHEYTSGPIVTPVDPHPLTGATLPQVLGHEFSGVVREVGQAVTTVRPGDRVAVMPSIVCNRCYWCRRGMHNLCALFASTGLSAASGGLASHTVLSEYQVAKLPDNLTDEVGALIEPSAVAAYALDRPGIVGGDTVLITGSGPVGVLSSLYAAALGAGTVIIAEPNPNRAAQARKLDVGPVLDPTDEGFANAIAELTGGIGVDVTAECSGTEAGLATAFDATRRAGSIVQTGLHTKPATIDAMMLSERDLTLYGSWCFKITDWPRIIALVSRGTFPVQKVITSRIPLDKVVDQGFDALIDPAADQLKVLVDLHK